MRKPSILLMNRVYPPVRGATGRLLRDMARYFAREGWNVTIITTGAKAVNERDGSVRVIRVKSPQKPMGLLGYSLAWVKMYMAASRRPAHDLVVTMTDPPLFSLAGWFLQTTKKSKHVHWLQDVYPDLFPLVGAKFPRFLMRGMETLNRKALLASDKVIVIGRCLARRLAYAGIAPKSIAVIPNWPDSELRHDAKHEDDDISIGDLEGDIAKDGQLENYRPYHEQIKTGTKFRVLYAGNIGAIHPVGTILDAARILQDEYPEIEFLFVGDGINYDEIAKAKASEHLDNVKLLPFQPASRLRSLMESGDVHLISLDERAVGMAVPCKLYSAIAARRPCLLVGSDQSEAAKVIQDYKFGQVVGQGRGQALADMIVGYRSDGQAWFTAHQNAQKAACVFLPEASMQAFVNRAYQVIGRDIPQDTVSSVDANEKIAAE